VVMTDPDAQNLVAIRCYQKAGFHIVRGMESVEGTIILMEKRK
jgi:RimJ/RimL family protein N-acetyltransferase